ncbi:MAG: hypothetical protein AAF828_02840 [Bacteroidota bacterium]
MTEEEKKDLTEKLFDGRLAPVEQDQLNEAIESDNELAEALKFEFALRKQMTQQYWQELEAEVAAEAQRPKTKGGSPWWGIGLAVLTVLGLAVAVWWSWTPFPFTRVEGEQLMRDLIIRGEETGQIGKVVGPEDDWRTLLLAATEDRRVFPAALNSISTQMDLQQACETPNLALYAGAIELYINRQPSAAAEWLDCTLITEDPTAADGGQLPVLLRAMATEDITLTLRLWEDGTLPLDTLPPRANRLLTNWLAINE